MSLMLKNREFMIENLSQMVYHISKQSQKYSLKKVLYTINNERDKQFSTEEEKDKKNLS